MVPSVQSSDLKAWLWFDESAINKPWSSQLLTQKPKVLFEHQYENWLDKGDRKLKSHLSDLTAVQHFESDNQMVNLALAARVSEGIHELSWQSSRQALSVENNQQNHALAMQLKTQYFGFSFMESETLKESVFSLNPVSTLEVFWLRQQPRASLVINGLITNEDSENIFSAPTTNTYQFESELVFDEPMSGLGWQWHGKLGDLYFHDISSDNYLQTYASYELNLALNLSIGYEWFRDDKREVSLLALEGETTSRFGYDNQLAFQSKSQMEVLQLFYEFEKTQLSIFLRRGKLTSNSRSLFDANSMSGYWSSLLVGSGLTTSEVETKLESAGLRLNYDAGKKWFGHLQVDHSELSFDGGYDYRINAFPFGLLERDQVQLEWEKAILILAEFGIGYQFDNWVFSYRVSQMIPIEVTKKEHDSVTQGHQEDQVNKFIRKKSGNRFFEMPDGHFQVISVQYNF